MTLTHREIAEAFSSHRFDEALPFVADDAEWTLVGQTDLKGVAAIADACRSTAAELSDSATRFTRFDVAAEGDLVVIDAVGVYTDKEGDTSSVAACDLYTFRDDRIVGIRSYAIEVTPNPDPAT